MQMCSSRIWFDLNSTGLLQMKWKRNRIVYAVVVLLTWAPFGSRGQARSDDVQHKRPYTVKDSIEMEHIVDPTRRTDIALIEQDRVGAPIESPDGKSFLLVTKRGILSNNTLEGTIWLFDHDAVSGYALGKSYIKPVPRKLVTNERGE